MIRKLRNDKSLDIQGLIKEIDIDKIIESGEEEKIDDVHEEV